MIFFLQTPFSCLEKKINVLLVHQKTPKDIIYSRQKESKKVSKTKKFGKGTLLKDSFLKKLLNFSMMCLF